MKYIILSLFIFLASCSKKSDLVFVDNQKPIETSQSFQAVRSLKWIPGEEVMAYDEENKEASHMLSIKNTGNVDIDSFDVASDDADIFYDCLPLKPTKECMVQISYMPTQEKTFKIKINEEELKIHSKPMALEENLETLFLSVHKNEQISFFPYERILEKGIGSVVNGFYKAPLNWTGLDQFIIENNNVKQIVKINVLDIETLSLDPIYLKLKALETKTSLIKSTGFSQNANIRVTKESKGQLFVNMNQASYTAPAEDGRYEFVVEIQENQQKLSQTFVFEVETPVVFNDQYISLDLGESVDLDLKQFGDYEYTLLSNNAQINNNILSYQSSSIGIERIEVSAKNNVFSVFIESKKTNQAPVSMPQNIQWIENLEFNLLANDFDEDTLEYIITQEPKGQYNLEGNIFSYQDINQNDSFKFKVFDGELYSNEATVIISANQSANEAPLVFDETFNLQVGESINFTLKSQDENPLVSFFISEQASQISGEAPNLTFTADRVGIFYLKYFVSDGLLNSRIATLTFNVSENKSPSLESSFFELNEDSSLNINLKVIDENPTAVIANLINGTANGILIGTFPNYSYTPNPNFYGQDQATISLSDGTQQNEIILNFNVIKQNDAPSVENIDLNLLQGDSVDFTIKANDVDNDSLTYQIDTFPTGIVSGNAPNLTFSADKIFTGTFQVNMMVSDGVTNTSATINVTINDKNFPPEGNNQTISLNKGESKRFKLDVSDDSDLNFSIVESPQGSIVEEFPYLTYTGNKAGNDSLLYQVNDGEFTKNFRVDFIINDVNIAPIAQDVNISLNEDESILFDLNVIDDSEALIYNLPPEIVQVGEKFQYNAPKNFYGSKNFTYSVNDGEFDSNIANINITIEPVNDPIVLENYIFFTEEDTSIDFNLNATDIDSNIRFEVTNPKVSLNNGIYTYTPEANFNGDDIINAVVFEDEIIHPITLTFKVSPSNDTIVLEDISLSLEEDTSLSYSLPEKDNDNENLTYTVINNVQHGTLTWNNQNFAYTPLPDFNGTDSFSFRASDGVSDSAVTNVVLNVQNVKDSPVALDENYIGQEDQSIELLLKSENKDDLVLSYSYTQPAQGTLSGTAPNLIYTPNTDFVGEDSFNFTITHDSFSSTATISISVQTVNDQAIAMSENLSTNEDESLNIELKASDVDGDTLSFIIVTQPNHGTLSGTTPNLIYTPNPDYNGSDSFSFKVNDGTTDSSIANVSIDITSINDIPTLNNQNIVLDEDSSKSFSIDAQDKDSSLKFTITSNTQNGSIVGTFPNFTYHPNINYAGTDYLIYTVSDGEFSLEGRVDFLINNINDKAFAQNTEFTMNEDEVLSLNINALDPDGDNIFVNVLNVSNGSVSGIYPNLIFRPSQNYSGVATVQLELNDGKSLVEENITININEVNDAPVIADQFFSTNEDSSKILNIIVNDESSNLTYTVTNAIGTILGSLPNLTYIPKENFNGIDTFTLSVSDGQLSSSANISVTVNSINDAPTMESQSFSLNEDTTFNFTLSFDDIDSDTHTFHITQESVHGTISESGGNFTYNPNPDYYGTDSFKIYISDGQHNSDIVTINLNINPINDLPQFENLSQNLNLNESITFPHNIDDIDSTFTLNVQSISGGNLTIDGLNYIYQAPATEGTYSAIITISDEDSIQNQNITFIVSDPNQAPSSQNYNFNIKFNESLDFSIDAIDPENDSLTLVLVNQTQGTLTPSGLNLTYVADQLIEHDYFDFKISDGKKESPIYRVNFFINTNRSPASVNKTEFILLGESKNINLALSDPDEDILTINETKSFDLSSNSISSSFNYSDDLNTWKECASENGLCSVSNDSIIRYGANGTYFYKQSTSDITCSNSTFGDPLRGFQKKCFKKLLQDSSEFTVSDDEYNVSSTLNIQLTHFKRDIEAHSLKTNVNYVTSHLHDFIFSYDLSKINNEVFWEKVQSDGQDILVSNEDGSFALDSYLYNFNKNDRKGIIYFKTSVTDSMQTFKIWCNDNQMASKTYNLNWSSFYNYVWLNDTELINNQNLSGNYVENDGTFNFTNDYQYAYFTSPAMDEFSIEFFIYVRSDSDSDFFEIRGNRNMSFYIDRRDLRVSLNGKRIKTPDFNIEYKWMHVAVSFFNNTMKFYVDGNLMGIENGLSGSDFNQFYIGNDAGKNSAFNGMIKDIRISPYEFNSLRYKYQSEQVLKSSWWLEN